MVYVPSHGIGILVRGCPYRTCTQNPSLPYTGDTGSQLQGKAQGRTNLI